MDNPVIVRAAEVCAEPTWRPCGSISGESGRRAGATAEAGGAGRRPRRARRAGSGDGAWTARDPRLLLRRVDGSPGGRSEPDARGLALIAPPLSLYDFGGLAGPSRALLLATGSRDPYCPLDAFQELAAGLPWAGARVIEGADHSSSVGSTAGGGDPRLRRAVSVTRGREPVRARRPRATAGRRGGAPSLRRG